jgi:hypothetical protein
MYSVLYAEYREYLWKPRLKEKVLAKYAWFAPELIEISHQITRHQYNATCIRGFGKATVVQVLSSKRE